MISTENLDHIILVMTIGLCEAIRQEKISIDEAQGILFSPYTMEVLAGRDSRVVDIIHSCTELEDFESLLPKELPRKLDEFKKNALDLLGDQCNWNFSQERWLKLIANT